MTLLSLRQQLGTQKRGKERTKVEGLKRSNFDCPPKPNHLMVISYHHELCLLTIMIIVNRPRGRQRAEYETPFTFMPPTIYRKEIKTLLPKQNSSRPFSQVTMLRLFVCSRGSKIKDIVGICGKSLKLKFLFFL